MNFGRKKPRRRGIAMLLVISVIAVTAVMGLAMLSEASLQAQTGRNVVAGSVSDGLVESGIDLACYYLIYPERAPSLTSGYWPGGSAISFGSDMPGTVDVTVTSLGSNDYRISATGHSAQVSSAGVARVATAIVHADPGFKYKYGAAFNGLAITIPAAGRFNYSIQGLGTITNSGIIHGTAYCVSAVNLPGGTIDNGWQLIKAATTTPNPTASHLRSYQTYTWLGTVYTAKEISLATLNNTTLGPTSDNPAGVFHRSSALTIQSDVTINGTLLADSTVNITGARNVITPQAAFPGAILKGDLITKVSFSNLTVNGVAWVGGSIKSAILISNTQVTVNGSLLFGGSASTIDVSFSGTVNSNYDATKVAGVELDTTVPVAGVTFESFKQ